jgi:hypothetical protein
VARAAARERLHAAGLAGDGPPAERIRGGALLVLAAWALFVVAGIGVQKFSEHWQAATPAADRDVPSGAFEALLVAAWIGSVLVVAGVVAALPSLARFLRGGGWSQVRRSVLVAAMLVLAAAPATVGIVVWADRLSPVQRDGRDAGYAAVAALWALLLVACLTAWTIAGVAASILMLVATFAGIYGARRALAGAAAAR